MNQICDSDGRGLSMVQGGRGGGNFVIGLVIATVKILMVSAVPRYLESYHISQVAVSLVLETC